MLKVKRDDYLELNNEDGNLNLDNVNDLFKKISENYKEENEEKKDGRKEDEI